VQKKTKRFITFPPSSAEKNVEQGTTRLVLPLILRQGRAGQAALVGEKKMGNGSFPNAALIKKALIIRER
jgi:hypothetical protein